MPKHEDNLTRAAIVAAAAADLSSVPAGEYEIRAGVEASVDGFNSSLGIHGRLAIGRTVRSLDDLVTAAVAELLGALGEKRAAAIAAELPAKLKTGTVGTAAGRKQAQRLIRKLRSLTGVSWRATPTYKPRY